MTINKTSGDPLSFQNDIEAEFGGNPARSLGQYRRDDANFTNESPSGSSLSNLPLDDGIPNNGEIKFSDFYGKKLNMVIDYYADTTNLNKEAAGNNTMAATWRYQNQEPRVKVVGGYRSRPLGSVASNYTLTASDWQGGKKIFVNINQTIGGKKGALNDVALRTGNWPTGTELKVDIGPSGYLTGAGGNGGDASGTGGNADGGNNGTSALGIEYAAAITNSGVIRCGYGGGGGGSGAANDPSDKSDTDYGRTGGGGGGGAGLPAGNGGNGGGSGSFNGPDPKDGQPGDPGTLNSGGSGGVSYPYEGANAGEGGDGGDFNDAAESGVKGTQGRPGVGYDAPGNSGGAGTDGKAIYYSSSSVQSGSTFSGNTIGGRNGGTQTGFFT